MVIRDCEVTFPKAFFLECNASWVTIKRRGKILYRRSPHATDCFNGEWYDASHRRIVAALDELEKSIVAACDPALLKEFYQE